MLKKIVRLIRRVVSVLGILILIIIVSSIGITYFQNKNNQTVSDYKGYYNAVKEAVYNYDSTLDINIKGYNKDIYKLDVVNDVLRDNPELNGTVTHYSGKVRNIIFATKITINFDYSESKEVLQARESEVNNKVKEIVNQIIKPEMKDYEKEAAIHDYIISNAEYDNRFNSGDMPQVSNTAYGVLVNKVGACLGYAQAMDKLLKASGIDSVIITGDADNGDGKGYEGHAWNLVKIGGQYYHIDATWDDPINNKGVKATRHSYFNLSDEQIGKNHKWDKSKYTACNSTEYNFNNLNLLEKDENGNDIVAVDNFDGFYSEIKKELTQGTSGTTFRVKNFEANTSKIESYISKAYKNSSRSGSCKYYYYVDNITNCGYIKVDFQ